MIDSPRNRKKQPDVVRQALLDCATKLALKHGLSAVSLQAVATAAGVTKGGLFHHFPNKQALIEAVFDGMMENLDREIDEELEKDEGGHGTFTRAYVRTLFADRAQNNSPWSAQTMTVLADPYSKSLWHRWMNDRLVKHSATDTGTRLEIVRLAADGAWLAHVLRPDDHAGSDDASLLQELIELTDK
ncbi:TetR/AcrR family transcriptional regulator [Rhizobium hidalgonense]|uniref:TetR/AcrR family transcriptional regulator n=1 Tax=Rhizobium hidalgonense TaxID=1538159 RepID=UPI00027D2FA8|nr:TetR/AcrR family transcriptional regulator [Rhizobium hidalgonense]EJC73462.1 transcriptional regulator [Rhizobium leguminosarum bv. trifolii WSM2012]MDR9803571.1 TetR/AcrR family transcriptional regulator [Rhizobium hidalgonense]RWX15292.1 TetR/AcrR family transcriptional regulator [Rhizobium hidalgonense]